MIIDDTELDAFPALLSPLLINDSLSIQNEIESFPISRYIQRYLNNTLSEIPPKPIHQISRIILALMGSLWGVPWITASSEAAIIFPMGNIRVFFEKLLAAGIVVTVGGDGVWLMLTLGDDIRPQYIEERLLTQKRESLCQKSIRLSATCLVSLISCISSVYAAIEYNSGAKKFLFLIILIVNYSYGLYGYSALIDKIIHKFKLKDPLYRELNHKKQKWISKLSAIIDSKASIPENITEPAQFIKYVHHFHRDEKNNEIKKNQGKAIFQSSSSLVISLTSSVVAFYLSKDAFKENIYKNSIASIIAAIFAELPGFIVTIISTYDVFGRVYDLLSCIDTRCKLFSPIIFVVSFGAPSAAAYITYSILEGEDLNEGLILTSTIAIALARVIFANFALYNLSERVISYCSTKKSDDKESEKNKQLIKLRSTLSQADPGFFAEIYKVNSKNIAAITQPARRSAICHNCIIL